MKTMYSSIKSESGKIGRNDPCFCGSGKKYKKCCLAANSNEEGQDDDAQTQQGLLQNLMNRVKTQHTDKECIVGTSEEMGLANMSDIITEFAEDILDLMNTYEEKKRVLFLAIAAWNCATILESSEEYFLEAMNDLYHEMKIKKNSKEEKSFTNSLFFLIKRKILEYGHIHRYINDFEVTKMTNDDFHLNIASIVVPPTEISQKSIVSKILGQRKKSKLLREPKS